MTYPSATLKPAAEHLVVRDPVTRAPLAADGERKPLDTYWCRRLADGDVVALPDVAGVQPAPKQPAAKSALKAVQGSAQ